MIVVFHPAFSLPSVVARAGVAPVMWRETGAAGPFYGPPDASGHHQTCTPGPPPITVTQELSPHHPPQHLPTGEECLTPAGSPGR